MGMFNEYANGTWVNAPPAPPPAAAAPVTPRPASSGPAPAPAVDEGESWSPNDPVPAPRPQPPPGHMPSAFVPKGELKPADLSPTDKLKSKAQDALIAAGMSPYNARHLGHGAVDIAGLAPLGSVLLAGRAPHPLPPHPARA